MKIVIIIFTFCLISDGGASKEVTGYLGGEVLIKCKYNTEYTQNPKYFCKGSSPGCSDLIKTGDKNMWVNSGQFSLFDDTKSAEISVMIRELTVEDTGMYQCGVDISLGNDIYTTVELKVKEVSTSIPTQHSSSLSSSSSLYEPTPASSSGGFRASTIITVCVILLLLLIGISVLLVILQKGRKMKAASHRTSVQITGNNQEVLLALCDFEEIKDTRQLSASETRFSTIYASLQLLTIPSELPQTVYANTELPASPCDPTVYSTVKFPTNPPDQDFYSTVQLH
ncbi:CMRF35-like molecule 8 isoform X5 [Silurus meridionalis]|uniref:CMRF35-like molecule 8 isoform X5 n=1 Tax=Silurus meridionalis TaxID=175797 RepID=UPI001EEAC2A6|nr:CMRF35-like molecule 8 isoform X5 [Silurus meridionalis]